MSEIVSKVWLPKNAPFKTTLEFLVSQFPQVDKETWLDRISRGKVHDLNMTPVRHDSPYIGDRHICYYREVPNEKKIPFKEKIIFENEHFILVDKPHFLPIHPSGSYLKETLVYRLRNSLRNEEIAPVHRIDRLTAGLVLFTKKAKLRKPYQLLFENRLIKKTYLAVSKGSSPLQKTWKLNKHLCAGDKWFLMKIDKNKIPNSLSSIRHIKSSNDLHLFQVEPTSGKKHQIRVHLASIGHPILNDPIYPLFTEKPIDNHNTPMQLLAKELSFTDPITKHNYSFTSERQLTVASIVN